MLVLVLGDAHIPERAAEVPAPIQKLLFVPNKFTQVVSVGNIADAALLKQLKSLTPGRHVVSVPGSSDIPDSNAKLEHIFYAGKFKIGVVASFEIVPAEDIDALSIIARKLDVDIVLWGGTHVQDVQSWAGHFFVNPGSVTGAPANWTEEPAPPGFALLDIDGATCTVYMYSQNGESLSVAKSVFKHPNENAED